MLVLFGVLPVVAAFFVALSFLGEQEVEPTQAEVKPVTEEVPPPPEPPETRQVFAAARAMPAGTLIREDDLIALELDPDAVRKEQFIVPNEVVLEEIVPGEQAFGVLPVVAAFFVALSFLGVIRCAAMWYARRSPRERR